MGILDIPVIQRVRRNHAIEHATIHILTPKYALVGLAGRADTKGFYLYGPVETEDVRAAASAAVERLKSEPLLAVHPRCGTNLVVGSFLGGITALAALATLSDDRRTSTFEMLPRLTLAAMVAGVAGQSLGPLVQERCTTSPEVAGAFVQSVERSKHGKHVFHRVVIGERAA